MPDVTIVYWRDIPAQIVVGSGRRAAKRVLPGRFERAIDRAAMKVGATGTDAYLEDWHRAAPYAVDGGVEEVATAEAARLDREYDARRLGALVENGGWA